MAKQVIGIGTTANDGTGDTPRVAFDKVNDNFLELYATRWIISADAPTETDIVWIDSPAIAGVYDVFKYIGSAWVQIGWYSIDGVFSTRPPLNIVIAGQSNAVGIGTGGDTTAVPGIITWSMGAEWDTGLHEGVAWQTATIGEGPFWESNNNIAFQLAKLVVSRGDAEIVRIMVVGAGGVGMAAWITEGDRYLYDLLAAELTASAIPQIDWFVWQHGESSGVTAADSGGYYVDLTLFRALLEALPQWVDGVSYFCAGGIGSSNTKADIYASSTPEGSIRMLVRDSYPYWTSVLAWDAAVADDLHFTAAGMRTMAERHYGGFHSLPKKIEGAKFRYDRSSYTGETVYLDTITSAGANALELNGIQYALTLSGTGVITVNSSGQLICGDATTSRTGGAQRLNVTGAISVVNGTNNVLVGDGFNPTGTSTNNTFLGTFSANRTTADIVGFTAIGSQAGDSTLRVASVFIGYRAGKDNLGSGIGDAKTMVGVQAGWESNGIYQTFVGYGAGQSSVGDYQVAVGVNAGAVDGSSYSNVVAIGYAAKWTKSNQVVLGNSSIVEHILNGTTTSILVLAGDRLRLTTQKTPASATATGTAGDICHDASYIYVCTATDTWKRVAIATW